MAATIGTCFLICSSVRRKWLYKNPFSKVIYLLNGKKFNHTEPIAISSEQGELYIELTPRVKYTISEVNLRFLIDGRNAIDTTNISVTDLQDENMASHSDFSGTQSDTVGGFMGFYAPHRVVSKGDVAKYIAKFTAGHQWQGKLELSLRITTQEFGRYPVRFECIWQPKRLHEHTA